MTNVVIAYIAVANGPLTHDYCARFAASYNLYPDGYPHQLVVVCNGGPLPQETGELFQFPCSFYPRVNDPGYDVSAFIDVARRFPCDMLLCLGESTHFHRDGWLKRMVEAWEEFGPGMYGAFSSNLKQPHLNTTGFAVKPQLLLGCAVPKNKAERYEFEHGDRAFWKRVQNLGFPVKLVTWDSTYDPPHWRRSENILWRGDQSNCLWWCIHNDRYFEAPDHTKERWQKAADGLSFVLA